MKTEKDVEVTAEATFNPVTSDPGVWVEIDDGGERALFTLSPEAAREFAAVLNQAADEAEAPT